MTNKKTNSFKKSLFKCFSVAIVVLAVAIYAFVKISPNTAQAAKDEMVNRLVTTIKGTEAQPQHVVITDTAKTVTVPQPVQEKKDSNVVVIPIKVTNHSAYIIANVNGIKMQFIIDTGCSDVQITSAEFFYMKHLGLISEDDIISEAVCTYADNSKEKCPVVKLKEINIGGIKLKDIECTIQQNAEASLLIGQELLKKLGEILIDYDKQELKIIRKPWQKIPQKSN